jgi:hypothetical protein
MPGAIRAAQRPWPTLASCGGVRVLPASLARARTRHAPSHRVGVGGGGAVTLEGAVTAVAVPMVRVGSLRVVQAGDPTYPLGRTPFPLAGWPTSAGPSVYLAGHVVERDFWSVDQVRALHTPRIGTHSDQQPALCCLHGAVRRCMSARGTVPRLCRCAMRVPCGPASARAAHGFASLPSWIRLSPTRAPPPKVHTRSLWRTRESGRGSGAYSPAIVCVRMGDATDAEAWGQLRAAVDRLRVRHGHAPLSLHKQFGHLFFGLVLPDVLAPVAAAVATVREVCNHPCARMRLCFDGQVHLHAHGLLPMRG